MSKLLLKRLAHEQKELKLNPIENCSAGPLDNTMMQWRATIFGSEDTPYHGGVFNLDIIIPPEYPFKPPTIKFLTPIYHCNIYNHHICLDILKDSSWAPCLDISKILLSICSLLSEPNPKDPLNHEASELLINNKDRYLEKARQYTIEHASD
jgi:ubiquitin-conjugating enzyme E2 D/E